jgi:hypothetical protein
MGASKLPRILFPFLVKLLPDLNGPAESLGTVITIGFFF